jgi:hypothetical protein
MDIRFLSIFRTNNDTNLSGATQQAIPNYKAEGKPKTIQLANSQGFVYTSSTIDLLTTIKRQTYNTSWDWGSELQQDFWF